jgi:hypothetical protein
MLGCLIPDLAHDSNPRAGISAQGNGMSEIKRKISRILEAEAAAILAIEVTDVFEDAVNTFGGHLGRKSRLDNEDL